MKKIRVLIFIVLLGTVSFSQAHDDEQDTLSVRKFINEYSEAHHLNFVVSPKILGEINLLGLNIEKMNEYDLEQVLNARGIIAVQKDQAIYLYDEKELLD